MADYIPADEPDFAHTWGSPEDCPACSYSKTVVERQVVPTRQCLGCLVDSQPHTCGYVAQAAIPVRWRKWV